MVRRARAVDARRRARAPGGDGNGGDGAGGGWPAPRAALPPTESTVLGPFYVAGAPQRGYGESIAAEGDAGVPVWVHGRVLGTDGEPIAGAELDVWQNGDDRLYAVQRPEAPEDHLRGRFETRADGSFGFVAVRPVPYPIPDDGPVGQMLQATGRHPWRPAHIHIIVRAAGLPDADHAHLRRRQRLPGLRRGVRGQAVARAPVHGGPADAGRSAGAVGSLRPGAGARRLRRDARLAWHSGGDSRSLRPYCRVGCYQTAPIDAAISHSVSRFGHIHYRQLRALGLSQRAIAARCQAGRLIRVFQSSRSIRRRGSS